MSTSGEDSVDTREFDAFVDGLEYTMFVVTAIAGGERSGCLVGFATQASIDPPRMLVCLSRTNHTFGVACAASVLAVHVLKAGQKELAELFGGETGDEIDKFERCEWHPGPEGVPVLADCASSMVGRVLSTHDFGDHVGFLLEPLSVRGGDGEAIMIDDVEDMEPGHQP